jgi:hypothetical protein
MRISVQMSHSTRMCLQSINLPRLILMRNRIKKQCRESIQKMVASPGARRPAARATASASRWHRFWGGFPSVIRRTRKDQLSAVPPKRSEPFSAPPKSGIQNARPIEKTPAECQCVAPTAEFPWAVANNPLSKPAASWTGFHNLLSPGGSRSCVRRRFSCSFPQLFKAIRWQRLTLARRYGG